VPDETIVEDYALSALAMEALLERLKNEYSESVEAVSQFAPAILNVVPETMVEFLEAIRTEYGSYEDLADTLGVSEAVGRLRLTLLEDV
jgi:Zn-dependent peptidase ImmA (M78 family)